MADAEESVKQLKADAEFSDPAKSQTAEKSEHQGLKPAAPLADLRLPDHRRAAEHPMFEVGFTELLLIFALALIVLGPEKLPKLAQQVGRWVGRARAMARQFRDQLDEEAHNLETKMNIDPGIDTSLDPKPAARTGVRCRQRAGHGAGRRTRTGRRVLPAGSPHAFLATRDGGRRRGGPEAAPAPEGAGGQAELDLTTPRDDESRSAP